jgi:hypothetical protein
VLTRAIFENVRLSWVLSRSHNGVGPT